MTNSRAASGDRLQMYFEMSKSDTRWTRVGRRRERSSSLGSVKVTRRDALWGRSAAGCRCYYGRDSGVGPQLVGRGWTRPDEGVSEVKRDGWFLRATSPLVRPASL